MVLFLKMKNIYLENIHHIHILVETSLFQNLAHYFPAASVLHDCLVETLIPLIHIRQGPMVSNINIKNQFIHF